MGYYSREVLATLILMIVTGAGRTLAVKLYFQLGFDDPFLVAILMLLGHSLAAPIYWLVDWLVPADAGAEDADADRLTESNTSHMLDFEKAGERRVSFVPDTDVVDVKKGEAAGERRVSFLPKADVNLDVNKAEDATEKNHSERADLEMKAEATISVLKERPFSPAMRRVSKTLQDLVHTEWKSDGTLMATDEEDFIQESNQTRETSSVEEDPSAEGEAEEISRKIAHARKRKSNRGSVHGLSEKSREAVQWVHKIPNWAKPIMSSVFNLLDVAFRMLSILFLAASVAEMLIGGMELILSIVAARVVRKRHIATQRWCGAAIMMVGLVLVACSDLVSDNESSESFGLGLLFVVLKVIMGVSKDMTQELFMQEGNISATLLLGMEGVYGLLMAIPLYFLLGPVTGYDPIDGFRVIGESPLSIGYTFGLLIIFFVAGMYSILGTAVTSSMTRNMWKNFRGLVVWIVALTIFYAIGDEDLGEPWVIPGSFMILGGFSIMLGALYVYYNGLSRPRYLDSGLDHFLRHCGRRPR